ncbi:MAG: GntR family transcriptional regulator [Oscillospiraceae bacterium]|nr:GntR family transcriptional regulator [Oscillospiraceae bacterium]MBQ5711107.1 GntR family transcriptional regulator [Oscillospiraceae bacterium]
MIHLDHRDRRPIYQQVLDSFREQIRAGILLEGDKLPSVRELAMELAINPNTIQRAYRELESEGWIASVAGKGSFVCGTPDSDRLELLAQFDTLVDKLLSTGTDAGELIRRIQKGDDDHA